jgi:hypothetical protein
MAAFTIFNQTHQMSQNYSNHRRLVPLFHFVTGGLILISFIGSIRNLLQTINGEGDLYNASLIVVVVLILMLLFFFTRAFALKAQDRAIRAEENFRHFILTGKPLDGRLRLSQLIALRFASDAEFPALADRAVREDMRANDIKKAIVNWRGDYHRV